jgi:hypothetical protein
MQEKKKQKQNNNYKRFHNHRYIKRQASNKFEACPKLFIA